MLLIVAILGGGSLQPSGSRAASGYVMRQGTSFVRDGVTLRPLGVNLYSAAGDPAIFQCGPPKTDPDSQLPEYIRRIRTETGSTVLRFWAFQSYTNGGTDWRALDRVVRVARENNVLLLPVLENQWADCTLGGPRDASWYAGGYRQPYGGYPLSYEEYVRRAVARYRDEPTIMAWMLMNEAEAKRQDGTSDPDALYGFADRMTSIVRGLDPNHLISLGVIGRGQPGTAYPTMDRLHALPNVDMVTYHDYLSDEVPMPGARLDVAGFSQSQDFTWSNGTYVSLLGRAWETVSYQLPSSGSGAPRRVGITMFGEFTGDLYVDQITVGTTTYDFEDGTTQGWVSEEPAIVEPTTFRAAAGTRSLKVRVTRPERGAHVWLATPPDLTPGATITASVYLETPGNRPPPDTLASAFAASMALDKPLLVSEAGMATCEAPQGARSHTPEDRALRMEAKIDAFFRAGGAGYLVWAWHPGSSCSFAFTSGDPLNGVLQTWAGRLAGR